MITFDVYTAPFDIENSLTPIINETIRSVPDSLSFVRAWRRKQLEYALISNSLQQTHISFERITARALDDTLARAGLDVADRLRTSLLDALPSLPANPSFTSPAFAVC